MILVYTEKITSRLEYALEVIFTSILGTGVKLTDDINLFKKEKQPKINYSSKELSHCLNILPHQLLFENDIKEQNIQINEWKGHPVFFRTSDQGNMPYDLFAAAFYLVTRYEEYHTGNKDKHNRYEVTASVAYKNGFLEKPVVNHYALEIKNLLLKLHPEYAFPEKQFQFLPTIDIDYAYAYLHRGPARALAGIFKDFIIKKKRFIERINVLSGRKPDPYDTYNLINDALKSTGVKPYYFFQVGQFGWYDRNLSVKNKAFQQLIRNISGIAEIGIHPSYKAHENYDCLKKEIKALENVTGQEITRSRQHFLKLCLPGTYRNLIKAGIKEDYTMGHAGHTGFRAGICVPYCFYDLVADKKTALKIYPFQVMDGTLNQYMQLTPAQAIEKCTKLIDAVKDVNGTFILLWHNSSFGDSGKWQGWKNVFDAI